MKLQRFLHTRKVYIKPASKTQVRIKFLILALLPFKIAENMLNGFSWRANTKFELEMLNNVVF